MSEQMLDDQFIYLTNRGAAIFKAALGPLGGRRFERGDQQIDLLYFDRYLGQEHPDDVEIGLQLIDRRRTIPLDNKASMATAMIEMGIEDPRVYFSLDEVPNDENLLWYVKDPMSTGGKGVSVVRRSKIVETFKPGFIIQEAVTDLLLHEGHKFTLRIYVLVVKGCVYLFNSGLVVRHAQPYNPLSEDPAVQYDHSGYMDTQGAVKLLPLFELNDHEGILNSLRKKIPTALSAFKNLLKYEPEDRFCLFGVDVLVKNDLSTVLVEINDRPNIVHTPLLNEQVNVPMIREMVMVLRGGGAELPSVDGWQFDLVSKL